MYPDIFVHSIDKIPEIEHYAIVKTGTIHIPGDERSKQHPGHGYPAEIRHYIDYEVYLTKEKLLLAIKEIQSDKYLKIDFKVLHVKPMTINTSITVDIA